MRSASWLVRTAAIAILAGGLAWSPPAAGLTLRDGLPITNQAGVTFGVLAHRGGALEWPENSVEAFRNSAEASFDGIETDILFTADGTAVMSHNDVLPKRCTHAGQSLHRMRDAEVAQVRCANLAGVRNVPIPTFAELAAVLADHPEVGLTLDIKSYPGQSATGKRRYAARTVGLLKRHGLLERTSLVSFRWDAALPEIRAAAPHIYVLALDLGGLDLDRARLAAKLGADGYGIRMKDTSAYLARYVQSLGMDSVPWEVKGAEQLAFTIHYGAQRQLFSSDLPNLTRQRLVDGAIELNPAPVPTLTTLDVPVTVASGTLKRNHRKYPRVLGPAVPLADRAQLDTVQLRVTVSDCRAAGRLYLGASSSPLASSVALALPPETGTFEVAVPLGDGGALRLHTTGRARVQVEVLGYTRVRFRP